MEIWIMDVDQGSTHCEQYQKLYITSIRHYIMIRLPEYGYDNNPVTLHLGAQTRIHLQMTSGFLMMTCEYVCHNDVVDKLAMHYMHGLPNSITN